MVLLTLLSIVQALALELLWSHVVSADYLLSLSWTSVLAWVRIFALFLGLILIWVVYASNTMRFPWVPVTIDSVYPFIIGLLEFMLIESLDPDESGQWLILMAVIFAVIVRVSHKTMQRARRDPENAEFFRSFRPATLRDFLPEVTIVGAMTLAGAYIWLAGASDVFVLFAVLAATFVLGWQFFQTATYWNKSVVDETVADRGDD